MIAAIRHFRARFGQTSKKAQPCQSLLKLLREWRAWDTLGVKPKVPTRRASEQRFDDWKVRSGIVFVLWIVSGVITPLVAQQPLRCGPSVPGKYGTPNKFDVAFNEDVSHWIKVTFTMFDDGLVKTLLKYENDSREEFCGGVLIRLLDYANTAIATFSSDPNRCIAGRSIFQNSPVQNTYEWSFKTTPYVHCRYAHLSILPIRGQRPVTPTIDTTQTSPPGTECTVTRPDGTSDCKCGNDGRIVKSYCTQSYDSQGRKCGGRYCQSCYVVCGQP